MPVLVKELHQTGMHQTVHCSADGHDVVGVGALARVHTARANVMPLQGPPGVYRARREHVPSHPTATPVALVYTLAAPLPLFVLRILPAFLEQHGRNAFGVAQGGRIGGGHAASLRCDLRHSGSGSGSTRFNFSAAQIWSCSIMCSVNSVVSISAVDARIWSRGSQPSLRPTISRISASWTAGNSRSGWPISFAIIGSAQPRYHPCC